MEAFILDGIMIDARTADDIWGSKDTIVGVENVRTTSGEDIVYGSQNSNTIMTGDGADYVDSGGGDDIIYGGAGMIF